MSPLQTAIQNISALSPEVMKSYLHVWKHWSLPRDHVILKEHAISDYIYFIEKGIARIHYYKDDKEITEWIAMDGQFFLSISSFFERTPSRLIIHTLEPSELWGIHHNDFMGLAAAHHEVERLLRKMVTSSLILSQRRVESIQFETAIQRYQKLLVHSPQILARVPLSYIASYLGITQETLSRIRSQR